MRLNGIKVIVNIYYRRTPVTGGVFSSIEKPNSVLWLNNFSLSLNSKIFRFRKAKKDKIPFLIREILGSTVDDVCLVLFMAAIYPNKGYWPEGDGMPSVDIDAGTTQ